MILNLIEGIFTYFITFGYKILDSLLSFLIIYIIYKVSCKIFKNIFSKKILNGRFEKGHADTIELLILSMIKYSFITVIVLMFIQKFIGAIGITITSIIGVALGFASQSIIKDLLNGIFITFENQFTVGDYISINKGDENFSGTVESVQARIIKLKDFNGDYHIIPNGFIKQVTNHSRKDSRILIDIKVGSEQKSQIVFDAITCALDKYTHPDISVKPYVYGIVSVNEFSTTYRVVGYSKPLSHWMIENKLRMIIMDELLDKNINLPIKDMLLFNN